MRYGLVWLVGSASTLAFASSAAQAQVVAAVTTDAAPPPPTHRKPMLDGDL